MWLEMVAAYLDVCLKALEKTAKFRPNVQSNY